jgi:hypothetical protein
VVAPLGPDADPIDTQAVLKTDGAMSAFFPDMLAMTVGSGSTSTQLMRA